MTKVAVILSGCGHLDGAEIRESVLSLLYLDQHGADVHIFAPDKAQRDCINHQTGQPKEESRNILEEAARIARGKIEPLSALKPEAFHALVLPGGYGAAKNLSDLALAGADATVLPEFEAAVRGFYDAAKPIGAICIAPAVLCAALKGEEITVTIGEDAGTASAIEAMGGTHQNCATDNIVVDEAHHIVSCSAYMRDDRLANVATGIEKLVAKVLAMVQVRQQAA
jgi:enhancing lycopene biosynthesis protein 2